MELRRTYRRPATAFVRSRKSPSVIVDRYSSRQKLANSEPIQRPTPEGQRENFLKLTKALEEDKINQQSFITREKIANDKSEREKRQLYHEFCVNFTNQKSTYQKKFEKASRSARNRSSDLNSQNHNLEDLERLAYRLEMGLDDPPEYEDKKEPIFVNKNTNYGIYDAKFSLSLAKFKVDNAPK
ncbi:hypothetical protein M9Y10_004918 [Tritrichomonas musculus]|uniref:Uncharacterized protein n=1 Tax=Tritrichomonas musculus TaxID=1915356 RepID=A0ABR2JK22_9EUKA